MKKKHLKKSLFISKKRYLKENKYNYDAISKLSTEEYGKLSLQTQKYYISEKQKKLKTKRKRLVRKFSNAILNKGLILSFSNPLKKNLSRSLDFQNNIIDVRDLGKSYFSGVVENKVIKDLNFKIKRGAFVTILGPSGSGKTTLLNLLSGLDDNTEGDIFVDKINLALLNDRNLTTFRKLKIGFIFQQYNLLPNLTVSENIEVGYNLSPLKNKKYIDDIIETIGLSEHKKKYPYQLSGGQQQRVSIARALAKSPQILFCDEPTGALDEVTGKVVLKVLKKINKKFKTTIIIVTHNTNIAKIADSILKIKDGNIESFIKNNDAKDVDSIR